MTSQTAQVQWYLAREGKQFGPLSDAELNKFIELGHLLPTDLVWREGFSEWRPAPSVFPPRAANPAPAPAPAPAPVRTAAHPAAQQRPVQAAHPARAPQGQQQQGQPQQGQRVARGGEARGPSRADPGGFGAAQRREPSPADFDDDGDFQPGSQVLRRAVKIIAVLAVLGGIGFGVYSQREQISSLMGTVAARKAETKVELVSDKRSLDVAPFKGLVGNAGEVDEALQQTALWRVIKREFPEWYEARIKQASELSAKQATNAEIAQQIAVALVTLRRSQLNNALSASVPRLKLVATTFFENLALLRKSSDIACFEFIARGEASPLVITMLQGSNQVPNLQAQMTAVYEAIADGRKTPRAYPQPRREDYEKLAQDLTKDRGWTQADLQLFTDERALAQAPPAKICQLVHDWFAAQLEMKDPDMQVRLLVDSLKPVVAG